MLLSLKINNFALIDSLELEFAPGLNVLTGETGAGKSIILDAIDAVLGGKVTARGIRTGAERAAIEATFQLEPELMDWLSVQEIECLDDNALICSRELSVNQGSLRSRARLNGVLVNKQQLESLRERLVAITAQGQTIQLGQPAMQRDWLDGFGGEVLAQQRTEVAAAFAIAQQALQALEKRRHSEQQRLQQLDLWQFQVRELKTANLNDPDELEQLAQERQRLSHSVELQQQSYRVYQALYINEQGGLAAADLLGEAETTLEEMLTYDPQVQPMLDLVSEALAQIQEAGRLISNYGEAIETDPQQLQTVEERIIELKQVCRKYGPTLADAIATYERIQTELSELTAEEQSLAALEQHYQYSQASLQQACGQLTQLRQAAAQELETRLIAELKPLAMEKVRFRVEIAPVTPGIFGGDRITFLFSPNPGEPLQPLTEIASGGEMSRFLLALKTCFSQVDRSSTLIFDEIDVGVSGRVTQAIAEKLHQLSQRHQVLCVTHQPIVAAMADQHFRVHKQVTEQPLKSGKLNQQEQHHNGNSKTETAALRTIVQVHVLNAQQRLEELALLAGGQSGQETIAFAESLLAKAAHLRQQPTPPTEKSLAPPSQSKTASVKPKKNRSKSAIP